MYFALPSSGANLTRHLIALFRAARLALHIGYGLTLAIAYPWFSLSLRRRILQHWSTGLLGIFNVRVLTAEGDSLHQMQSGLIVTNHISWLDVFVLNAVVPMRFVAKSEVRSWPVIGWLCARAQTIFIERGKARSAARINVQLVSLLQRGECLAIFPEGTTTDGKQVAHFHASLLQPAIDAAAKVHPVAIRYQNQDGSPSMAAAYIDEMSFGASMWNILSTKELHVRLITTPALDASGMDRRNLTHTAHQHISAALAAANAAAVPASHAAPEHELELALRAASTDLHFQSLYCVLLSPTLANSDSHSAAK
jgi:1-acyl-sn-glycerol-3-phosphate acyltransferase